MDTDSDLRPALLPATFDAQPGDRKGMPIGVLMSGGVDSSVTAMLLRDAGWDVIGITMKIPVVEGCSARRPCCGTGAAFVCRDLCVAHYFVDTESTFRACVVEPFRKAYFEGRTPSPCVDCNTYLKFDLVWDVVRRELGIEHLATGHYARCETVAGVGGEQPAFALKRALDKTRDQSYFLYGIARERLPFMHFPLGGLEKTEVRRIASARGLHVAAKPDSMELCFAGEGDYRGILGDLPARPGPIYDVAGNRLGEHSGIQNYTVGQRRGLGVASNDRLYVVRIVPEENAVIVGAREDALCTEVRTNKANVLLPEAFVEGARLYGKVRSVGEPESCVITRIGAEGGVEVQFDRPVLAPAPGQHLVLYDGEESVVAGGEIER